MEPIELLDFTNKFVQTQENHDQGIWMNGVIEGTGTAMADQNICGTTGCVAGFGAIFGGWYQCRPHRNARGSMVYDVVVNPASGETMHMRDAAKEEFGLTNVQADSLFSATNDKQGIQEMVDALKDDENANLYWIHKKTLERRIRAV